MNIYRELFATKLWDKLLDSSSPSVNNNVDVTNATTNVTNEVKLDELNVLGLLYNNNNNNSSSITEGVFEKIALMEFEASIYSQLSCSQILLYYFQRIVANEIKSIRNKPSRTILVSPVEKKDALIGSSSIIPPLPGSNDYFATWTQNTENLKLMSKKLSLTISDLGI